MKNWLDSQSKRPYKAATEAFSKANSDPLKARNPTHWNELGPSVNNFTAQTNNTRAESNFTFFPSPTKG
jgi:hypothetical protein